MSVRGDGAAVSSLQLRGYFTAQVPEIFPSGAAFPEKDLSLYETAVLIYSGQLLHLVVRNGC